MKLTNLKPRLATLRTGIGQPAASGGWQTGSERGNTTQRGYGWAWQKLRKEIMERDNYLCQTCKRAGRVEAAHAVDHIIQKADGGTDAPSNLAAICEPCHLKKTARESSKRSDF